MATGELLLRRWLDLQHVWQLFTLLLSTPQTPQMTRFENEPTPWDTPTSRAPLPPGPTLSNSHAARKIGFPVPRRRASAG
jgi:hypothetical protein